MHDQLCTFWSADAHRHAQWYEGVLGLPAEYYDNGAARIDLQPLELAFLPLDQAPEAPSPHAVVAWFTVDDLDGALERFLGEGGQIDSPPLELGAMTLVRVRDPFGALVAVVGPPADAEPFDPES